VLFRSPIEFARISQDGRLTLVIHAGSDDQQTCWALSEFATLEEARRNLRMRENSRLSDIHWIRRWGGAIAGVTKDVGGRINKWMESRKQVEAVAWTGLPSNWKEKRGRAFAPDDAVAYLLELESHQRVGETYNQARRYVTHAPPLIDTPVRRAMRERGWEDAYLPPTLFEPLP